MTIPTRTTRRDTLGLALAAGAGLAAAPATAEAAAAGGPARLPGDTAVSKGRGDFDFLVGKWKVRHRRLTERLAGSTDWQEFDGTSDLWLTLDGLGTIDENWLDIPTGAYKAVGVRAYDQATGKWSIWWLDGRYPASMEPPVRGGFTNGVGEFLGDDVLRDKPIKVRFRWLDITPTSARWEQAFSPDGGRTWEVNWEMAFTRA